MIITGVVWPVLILKRPGEHQAKNGQDDAQVKKEVGIDHPAGQSDLENEVEHHQQDAEEGKQPFAGGEKIRGLVDEF